MGEIKKFKQKREAGEAFSASMRGLDVDGVIYRNGDISFDFPEVKDGDRETLEAMITILTGLRFQLPERPARNSTEEG